MGASEKSEATYHPGDGPSLKQRVSAAALKHMWVEHNMACACGEGDDGRWNYTENQYAAHLMDVLIEALGLYEERRTNAMSSAGQTTDTRTGVTTFHSDIRCDRRWVSAWEEG